MCWPSLDSFQQVNICPVLVTLELDSALHVGSHQSKAEWQNALPCFAGHVFDAAQDTFGFLDCKCMWLGHVQPLIHQHPQVLLCRAALNLFSLVLILGVAPIQVQHLALYLVKPHKIPMDPVLEFVQVSLYVIPSFRWLFLLRNVPVRGHLVLAQNLLSPVSFFTVVCF